jgi:GT2 family glycosyltransferase
MGGRPTLAVIIVSWNERDYLDACLAALVPPANVAAMEVVVVDNGSTDGSVAWLGERHPGVRVVANPANRGVAPARNQGLLATSGTYRLLLDADTVVRPGALAALVDGMERFPGAGLSGPKLVDPEHRLQFSCRRFPTAWSKLARQAPAGIQRRLLRREEFRDWDHGQPRWVDYVIGACQCIRGALLESVGLLDERIFYGPEDVDFCLRLWRAGHRVLYNPAAVVVHREQRSARRSAARYARHFAALWYFFRKHGYLIQRPTFAGSGLLAA